MATAQSLEDVLKQVEDLRNDLSAEVVVQEGSDGYYEEVVTGGSWINNYYTSEQIWRNGEPRIAHPDTEKRESARQQLQQFYDSSEFYSARYSAGKAIGIDVNDQFRVNGVYLWLKDLDSMLNSTKTEISYRKLSPAEAGYDPICCGKSYDTKISVEESRQIPDLNKRMKAAQDLIKLISLSNSEELKKIAKKHYKTNEVKKVRGKIGKALGYSPLRIWAHENPVAATMNVITVAGGASGIGYIIYQYLSR